MNFTTLKARLLAQIGRAPSELCYELVTADINQNLRLHHMLTEVELTAPYTLPADFLQAQVVLAGDSVLSPASEAVRGRVPADCAQEFTVSDDKILLDVDEDTITLRYYAKVANLNEGDDTNTILTNNPSVYVYGVLTHHATLVRDQSALAQWRPTYENFMVQVQKDDNLRRMSASAIKIKAPASA